MPSLSGLLGPGSVAEQLLVWGLLNQLLGDFLGPALELVRQDVNAGHPEFVLTPADVASAVVRNFMSTGDAQAEAAKNGINADRLATLVHLSGDAPGPYQLAEALRRGIVVEGGTGPDSTSFVQGIAEGRLADKWAPIIKALAVVWPTPTDALDALLQGQVDEQTARALFQRFGGAPDYFQLLFDTRGSAPTPNEAAVMANRGIIPWEGTGPEATSFEQAFLEGPWRNKWESSWRALAAYHPPPRTVVTLFKSGAIDAATATSLFEQQGLTADLAAAYLKSASGEKLEGTHQLASATIALLYDAGAISSGDAVAQLGRQGYTAAQAAYLLEVRDLQREVTAFNAAVRRIGTLYTSHRITRNAAVAALTEFGVVGSHQDRLMATWDLETVSEVRLPTITEIGTAAKVGAITGDQAVAEALKLGYTPFDAYVALSAHYGGPITPTAPAQGPVGPGVI